MLRLAVILLPVAVLLLLAGCQRRAGDELSMDTVRAEGAPAHESWGAHFYVSQVPVGDGGSRPRFEIRADYLGEFARGDSTYTLLRSEADVPVRAILYDAAGDSAATLTARRVFYFEDEQRFEARGAVVVVTREGKRLESEHLLWFEEDRRVRTPGFVRIITPSERVQGYGLDADEDLATYRLSRVTAEVEVEDEG